MIRPSLTILMLSAVCLRTGTAVAQPHVLVTMMSELICAADGSVTGGRHNWTFDDMLSVFATQGLESKKRGVFTREELASLAEVIEVAAAAAITGFGVLLLCGYLVNERMIGL